MLAARLSHTGIQYHFPTGRYDLNPGFRRGTDARRTFDVGTNDGVTPVEWRAKRSRVAMSDCSFLWTECMGKAALGRTRADEV